MKKGFFICIIGIDGTGKTTLSKNLTKVINKKGIVCEYVYARLNPFILKPFMLIGELIFLKKNDIYKNYLEYKNIKTTKIKKHFFLSKIYQQILLFDYYLQILLKIKIPLLLGSNIVCDRYIYDTVITDISVDMSYSKDKTIFLLKKLLSFFPKPDLVLLVDISEDIAYSRKKDVPSIEYLKDRRYLYLAVGQEFNMFILDGSKKLNELNDIIMKEVKKAVLK